MRLAQLIYWVYQWNVQVFEFFLCFNQKLQRKVDSLDVVSSRLYNLLGLCENGRADMKASAGRLDGGDHSVGAVLRGLQGDGLSLVRS